MTQSLARESHQAEVRRCGLPGLVERRSRPFTVDGVDQKLISRARPLFEVVRKAYFRVDSSGWEQLPEPPVLLVGVHAGATTSALPAPSGNTRPALQKNQARSPGQAAARCLPTGTA